MQLTNKECSDCLDINFAKWKRWAREFCPVNISRGHKRLYSYREAFQVFLGGHLVDAMGFSIIDARKILTDLEEWLNEKGIFNGNISGSQTFRIKIIPDPENQIFLYDEIRVEWTKELESEGGVVIEEMASIQPIVFTDRKVSAINLATAKVLEIDKLRVVFWTLMGNRMGE